MANTLKFSCNGAVGFIGWLDGWASQEPTSDKNGSKNRWRDTEQDVNTSHLLKSVNLLLERILRGQPSFAGDEVENHATAGENAEERLQNDLPAKNGADKSADNRERADSERQYD